MGATFVKYESYYMQKSENSEDMSEIDPAIRLNLRLEIFFEYSVENKQKHNQVRTERNSNESLNTCTRDNLNT